MYYQLLQQDNTARVIRWASTPSHSQTLQQSLFYVTAGYLVRRLIIPCLIEKIAACVRSLVPSLFRILLTMLRIVP